MRLAFPSVLFLGLCSGALGSFSKPVILPCDRPLFESKLELCLSEFNRSLEREQYRQSCVWPNVRGPYFILKYCVDGWAAVTWCSGVGTLIDEFFMDVHQTYFPECGNGHVWIQDPPIITLILMVAPLVMTTLLLAMLCGYLATKNQT